MNQTTTATGYTAATEECIRFLQTDAPGPLPSREAAEEWQMQTAWVNDIVMSLLRGHHGDPDWDTAWVSPLMRRPGPDAYQWANAAREIASRRGE